MKRSEMITVMVAAVNALDNNEIADDLMDVATLLEEEWADEIENENDNYEDAYDWLQHECDRSEE